MDNTTALAILLLASIVAGIGVWGWHRHLIAINQPGRAKAVRLGATTAVAAIVLGYMGVALWQTMNPGPREPGPRPFWVCRYVTYGDTQGLCGGVRDGSYVEIRAAYNDPDLTDPSRDVFWAGPATGSCPTAYQYVRPLFDIAATELERHRALNLRPVATVLTHGQGRELVDACRYAQPLNNLLVLAVDGIVLQSSGASEDLMDSLAGHLRDQLANDPTT